MNNPVHIRCMICRDQHGFTMVEMVVVIIITAIIAAIVAVFIRAPVQSYVDSVARAELTDVADLALRRLARDIRLALPNSVRVTQMPNGDVYLEMLLTKTGGRYLAEEDNQEGNILNFTNVAAPLLNVFDVVSAMPIEQQAIVENDQIVVYNLGPGLEPADAYACAVQCNRARVTNVAGTTVTLENNPFAAQTPTMKSPSHRFQVVTTPVTYVCSGGTLTRYWNYWNYYNDAAAQPTDISATPLADAATNHALLANGIVRCNFDYNTLANVRTALVGITLSMEQGSSGRITLFHQVHVDNTP